MTTFGHEDTVGDVLEVFVGVGEFGYDLGLRNNYLSAYFVDELFGVNGVVGLVADYVLDYPIGLLVNEFLKVVENGLVDFAHVLVLCLNRF